MLNKFKKFYQQQCLFTESESVLLTVSGGKDSLAMVQLFYQAKLNFGIAHCNFKLRGKESDKDEKFVKKIAEQLGVDFYSISFDTNKYAKKHKISTQMAARELRYRWFEEIRRTNNYQFIATAHHKNDVVETVLINLTKGTGLAGLHGIASKSEKIIRPLLCFTSDEIIQYMDEHNFSYREDQSNKEVKYVRNKIRHKVVPELEKINPSIIETIYKETLQFAELEKLLESKILEEKKNCVKENKNTIEIELEKLKKLYPAKTYLYYFIKDYGFNFSDVEDIMNSIEKQSGKIFISSTHQLIKDRNKLITTTCNHQLDKEYVIKSSDDFKLLPFKIISKNLKKEKTLTISKNKNFAYLDVSKIEYPLLLRKWKKGDRFKPFGMKNFKKVSDFFIDEKLSVFEKKNTWLLTKNDDVIWVVNHRISNDYKIDDSTDEILILELKG